MAEQNNQGMNPNLLQGLVDAIAGGALAGLSLEAQQDFLSPFLKAQQTREAQKLETQRRAEDLAIRKEERAEDKAFQLGRDEATREHQLELEGIRKKESNSTKSLDTFMKSVTSRAQFGSVAEYDAFVKSLLTQAQDDPDLTSKDFTLLNNHIGSNREVASARNKEQSMTRYNERRAAGDYGDAFVADFNAQENTNVRGAVSYEIREGKVGKAVSGLLESTRAAQKFDAENGINYSISDADFNALEKAYAAFEANPTGETAAAAMTLLRDVDMPSMQANIASARQKAMAAKTAADVAATMPADFQVPVPTRGLLMPEPEGLEAMFVPEEGPRADFARQELFVPNANPNEVNLGMTMMIAPDQRAILASQLYQEFGYEGAKAQVQRYQEAGVKVPDSVLDEVAEQAVRAFEVTSEVEPVDAAVKFEAAKSSANIAPLLANRATARTGLMELVKAGAQRDPATLRAELKEARRILDIVNERPESADDLGIDVEDLELSISTMELMLSGEGEDSATKDAVYGYGTDVLQLLLGREGMGDPRLRLADDLAAQWFDADQLMADKIQGILDRKGTVESQFAALMRLGNESSLIVQPNALAQEKQLVGSFVSSVTKDFGLQIDDTQDLPTFRKTSSLRGIAMAAKNFEQDIAQMPLSESADLVEDLRQKLIENSRVKTFGMSPEEKAALKAERVQLLKEFNAAEKRRTELKREAERGR